MEYNDNIPIIREHEKVCEIKEKLRDIYIRIELLEGVFKRKGFSRDDLIKAKVAIARAYENIPIGEVKKEVSLCGF